MSIDNKIYACVSYPIIGSGMWLGIIHQPNVPSTGCNFVLAGLQLQWPTAHVITLPQWVHTSVIQKWPKVYYAKHPEYFQKDENNKLLLFLSDADVTLPNLNHMGVLPNTPYTGQYTFHYTLSGVTKYTKTHSGHRETFPLHSGDVQIGEYVYPTGYYNTFFSGVTGITSPTPPAIPQDEIILAESNTGVLITRTANYTALYVHNQNITSPPLNMTQFDGRYVFNPTTNNLFFLPNSIGDQFLVYHLDIINNLLIQSYSIPFTGVFRFLHVDNQDNVYVLENSILRKYNYTSASPNTSSISISGFSNLDSRSIKSNTPYTSNMCLVMHQAHNDNRIYALDFNTLTSKKIDVSSADHFYYEYYIIDGDRIYIAGCTNNPLASIGNQAIPELYHLMNSFITKLSLQGDFSFRSSEILTKSLAQNKVSFEVSLSPNPSNSSITLILKENDKQNISSYTVSIVNQAGNTLLKKEKYISGNSLNISNLKAGTYYVEILNNRGEKVSKNIIKL